MYLEPLALVDGAISEPVLTELTALYASNAAFFRLSGDFPDPGNISSEQVASSISSEFTRPASEVLLLRDQPDRLVGLACVLHEHPDPADPDPWIGLLLIHSEVHGRGFGRVAAAEVEKRFRSAHRNGVRLAVLENNPVALKFWTAIGYQELARREDQLGRPCRVLHKELPINLHSASSLLEVTP